MTRYDSTHCVKGHCLAILPVDELLHQLSPKVLSLTKIKVKMFPCGILIVQLYFNQEVLCQNLLRQKSLTSDCKHSNPKGSAPMCTLYVSQAGIHKNN